MTWSGLRSKPDIDNEFMTTRPINFVARGLK
jgi:hypothetical protein